jgi:hypothetical protein
VCRSSVGLPTYRVSSTRIVDVLTLDLLAGSTSTRASEQTPGRLEPTVLGCPLAWLTSHCSPSLVGSRPARTWRPPGPSRTSAAVAPLLTGDGVRAALPGSCGCRSHHTQTPSLATSRPLVPWAGHPPTGAIIPCEIQVRSAGRSTLRRTLLATLLADFQVRGRSSRSRLPRSDRPLTWTPSLADSFERFRGYQRGRKPHNPRSGEGFYFRPAEGR